MPVYGVWGWGVSNRSTFEKAFPVPAGIYWNEISEQYDGLPGSVGLDEIEAYQARFEGWQAAQSPASGEVEPVYQPDQQEQATFRKALMRSAAVVHSPAKVPDGWALSQIHDPKSDGYLIKGPGIAYCAWKDKDPWLYLFCEALTTPTPATTPEAGKEERLTALNKDQAQTIGELDCLVHSYRKTLRSLLPLIQLPPIGDPDREVCKEDLELAKDLISGADLRATTPEAEWVKCEDRLPTEADADCDGCLWVCWYDCGWRMEREYIKSIDCEYFAWMRTGLKRPTPPTAQGGE